MLEKPKTAKARYDALVPTRLPYLERARECAEFTIPSLMPPEGMRGQALGTPWQSVGAEGVNTLASKMVLTLMPPGTAFFKFGMSQQTELAMAQLPPEQKAEVGQALVDLENGLLKEIDEWADRVAEFEAEKQLVVCGNALTYIPSNGTMRVYRLDQYVVKRDQSGNPVCIVIKESISPLALPDNLAAAAQMEAVKENRKGGDVDVYTVIERQNRDFYRAWQEVCDQVVPGSEGWLPADAMPYQARRWTSIDGEDYGRGRVEEYLGDLQSLDGLQKAVVEGAAASAKIVYLRNPASSTTAEKFSSAENGDVVDGVKGDFEVVQAQKFADLTVAKDSVAKLESRLARAFLMLSSVQRQAERVTAEEIRVMAGELEDALGGIYSRMTLDFQLPYVRRRIALMQMQNKMPHFPKGSMKPSIVTGMAALGRNHEVAKTMAWAQACSAVIGPEAFARAVNSDALLKQFGTGFGVKVDSIVKTAQQIAQENAAQAQRENLQALGPSVIQAKAKTA